MISTEALKNIRNTLKDKALDLGVSIHRTNALPLDMSSIIILESNYDLESAFREAAWAAVEAKAQEDPTTYPGQQITVIGTVDGVDKVIGFILQGDTHKHLDYNIASNDESETAEHVTKVQELAYKSYVDKLTIELQGQIGNLASVMNFRGVFESFTEAATAFSDAAKPLTAGDVIIISGTVQNGASNIEGKPGMEYVYTGTEWQELGFGSQVIQFINGNDGLTLPSTIHEKSFNGTTLLEYIKQLDSDFTTFIGKADLSLPTEFYGKALTPENLLDYLQKVNSEIINFLGTTDSETETLQLPDSLLNAQRNFSSVLEYTQAIASILEQLVSYVGAKKVNWEIPDHLNTDKFTASTLLEYVKEIYQVITKTVGTASYEENSFQMPETLINGGDYISHTLLNYITASDTEFAKAIGFWNTTEDIGTAFRIKETLPVSDKAPTNNTVLGFVKESDNEILAKLDETKAELLGTEDSTLPVDNTIHGAKRYTHRVTKDLNILLGQVSTPDNTSDNGIYLFKGQTIVLDGGSSKTTTA